MKAAHFVWGVFVNMAFGNSSSFLFTFPIVLRLSLIQIDLGRVNMWAWSESVAAESLVPVPGKFGSYLHRVYA